MLISHLTRLDGSRAALLADPPGAGKTPQAIFTILRLQAQRILVVCPSSLKENWKREAVKWSSGSLSAVTLKSGKDVSKIDDVNVVVVSYDLATRSPIKDALAERSWDFLVCDESHALKSPSSVRARVVCILLWSKARFRLLITGTPLPNGRASEAWSTFCRLAPKCFGDWTTFKNRYCIPEETQWGVSYPRSKNLEELGALARKHFMVRRKREEVLGQLPPLVRQSIPLDIPALKVLEAAGEFQEGPNLDAIIAAVESGVPLMSDHISTARRKLGALKVLPALEYISDVVAEVGSCVVFAHHRDVISGIAEGLKDLELDFVTITGDTASDDRQRAVDDFQTGRCPVFLASLTAANTGITLTRSQTVIFVEADWVPSTNEQAEGRVYRVSQKDITRAIYLVVPDSLDEAVTRSVLRKQRDIRKVMTA